MIHSEADDNALLYSQESLPQMRRVVSLNYGFEISISMKIKLDSSISLHTFIKYLRQLYVRVYEVKA